MSPEQPIPNTEPTPLPGHLVVLAKEWSDGRPAKELCMELYVRWLQLASVCYRLSSQHGTDLDGEPLIGHEPHPIPHPDELRRWLAQLLPPGSPDNQPI